eukprot:9101-Heterococcus_DN1.PRE.1
MDMAASLRAKARRWASDGSTAVAAPAATVSGSADDDDDDDDATAPRSSTTAAAAAAAAAATGAAQQPLSTGTKLLEFSQHMKRTGLLSTEEAAGVRALVQEGSLVLNSAYAVALADKDLEYLAALLKDIAVKWLTDDGQDELASQSQLLEMTDVLYRGGRITASQSIYLQNLTLVGSEM